jgi:hypothetical protein
MGVDRRAVPSLRDAHEGWQDFVDGDVPSSRLARWQHRHTLGHAISDIAVPSIVFVPEDTQVGLAVDDLPAALQPTVRFGAPAPPGAWPREPLWLPRDEVAVSLRHFVEETLQRAEREEGVRPWAHWLNERWQVALRSADDPAIRRELQFGEVVAEKWPAMKQQLGESVSALLGILSDSPSIQDAGTLDALAARIPVAARGSRRVVEVGEVDLMLPPYEQGYRLAAGARRRMQMLEEPILDMRGVLGEHFDVITSAIAAEQLFRSAAVSVGNEAQIWYASEYARVAGVAPTRFAIAAALGRLLFEERFRSIGSWGAAHGSHSRWIPTRVANAFAAEFLLPAQAMRRRGGDAETLAEEYGISRSAAAWHIRNRLRAVRERERR